MSIYRTRGISHTPARLVNHANEYSPFNYDLSWLTDSFSHKDNIVNIHISHKEGCAVKIDFVPTRVESHMDAPRGATDGERYALIRFDNVEYFDDLSELIKKHDTDFTRLLLLEAKFEKLTEQLYWMPGGPGYSMAKESYEENARKSTKKE
jgi:hypothetical protein